MFEQEMSDDDNKNKNIKKYIVYGHCDVVAALTGPEFP